MKFAHHTYWKHDNCLDVFYAKGRVQYENDKSVKLKGTWCTQGVEHWWFTLAQKLDISLEQYDHWKPYTPKGTPIL